MKKKSCLQENRIKSAHFSMMFQAAKSEIKRKRTVTSMKEVVDEHRYREYIWKMVSFQKNEIISNFLQ